MTGRRRLPRAKREKKEKRERKEMAAGSVFFVVGLQSRDEINKWR